MKKDIDPKIFIAAIAVVVVILGVVYFKSTQVHVTPHKPTYSNPMFKPGTPEYRQAMQDSNRQRQGSPDHNPGSP
jgi:cell division protein FtsN